jgi:enoyl-CoA hydratase/carnithine racemase
VAPGVDFGDVELIAHPSKEGGMSPESLVVEKQGTVTHLRLNRPESLNTLTPELIARLDAEIRRLRDDETTRAVVLIGAGRAFCAGVQVGDEEYDPLSARRFLKNLNRVFQDLEGLPQPTVAALNGDAVAGGLELALACTFRVCAEQARMGLPEARLGLVAAVGTTYRLPRLVGFSKAMEMCLLGDLLSADEAMACGLVNRKARPDLLFPQALALAQRLTAGAPVALGLMKDALYANAGAGSQADALLEVLSASVNHYTQDKKEGLQAFFEKREPRFQGR